MVAKFSEKKQVSLIFVIFILYSIALPFSITEAICQGDNLFVLLCLGYRLDCKNERTVDHRLVFLLDWMFKACRCWMDLRPH